LTPQGPYVILERFNFNTFNMLKEILGSVNPVDILIFGIFIRIIWIGAVKGLMVEFFKFFGILFATFVTLHYFTRLAQYLQHVAALQKTLTYVLAFGIIWLLMAVIFKIVREGWMLMINPEGKNPFWQRIGGGLLAVFRAVLISGMAFMMIFASGNQYLAKKAGDSWTGFYFMDVSPQVYKGIFNGLIGRFFPDEEINKVVFGLKDIDQTP